MASKKVNSTQLSMFMSAREYISKPVHFFLILHNTVHISINNSIFKHLSAKKCHIDWRRKLHLTKSERIEGVYLKHWWKISICLYLSFLGLTKPKRDSYLFGAIICAEIARRTFNSFRVLNYVIQSYDFSVNNTEYKSNRSHRYFF